MLFHAIARYRLGNRIRSITPRLQHRSNPNAANVAAMSVIDEGHFASSKLRRLDNDIELHPTFLHPNS